MVRIDEIKNKPNILCVFQTLSRKILQVRQDLDLLANQVVSLDFFTETEREMNERNHSKTLKPFLS